MRLLLPLGRAFFAVALIGLGIEHYVFREFVTGRAPPWPASIPGGVIWAYATGLIFVAVGVSILAGRHARSATILAATLICLWALLRNIPVVSASAPLSGAWTRTGKSLFFVGACLAIASTAPAIKSVRSTPVFRFLNQTDTFIVVARYCLALFFVVSGIQHFMFVDFVVALIPQWFPASAVFWAYFAGVALICAGVGLVIPATARIAGLLSGLMVFSWVWIVHLPRVFTSMSDAIAIFEALAVTGLALLLAGWPDPKVVAVEPGNDAARTVIMVNSTGSG